MDIIIPLGTGSKWQNNELRYSLRSIEMFANNVGNVFIIGEKPDYLKESDIEHWEFPTKEVIGNGIFHIPAKDQYGSQRNIHEKIKIACLDERVSDDFLFWNDDFFLTDLINCEVYPYYQNKTLAEKISKRIANDGYRRAMENSLRFLTTHNRWSLYYDIHCPIIYNKKKYLELMELVDWTVPNGYVIKSLYANYWRVEPLIMDDLKITADTGLADINNAIKDRHIFSISDGLMLSPAKTMKNFLESSYDIKSKYEK